MKNFICALLILPVLPHVSLASMAADSCAGTPGSKSLNSETSNYRFELLCESGLPKESRRYFQSTGHLSQRVLFNNQRQAVERRSYNNSGIWTGLARFEHLTNGHIVHTVYKVRDQQEGSIDRREELSAYDPESMEIQHPTIHRKWFFAKDGVTVDHLAVYKPGDTKRIRAKEYLDASGKIISRTTFFYRGDLEKPVGFREVDSAGNVLSENHIGEPFEVASGLRAAGLDETEVQRRVQHQKSTDRFLIGIIDTGFDYNHPDLVWKWHTNPSDPVDGIDNDGNGWIDDQFGWDREFNSPLPSESSTRMTSESRPDSHGTHVAHIATRDIENVALVGFAGNFTLAPYVDKISAYLKTHKVKVVNISLGMPDDFKDDYGLRDGNKAYERMVLTNPDTLFVVAAGNQEQELDEGNKQFPASVNLPNILKVGSLTTNHIDMSQADTYKMSFWSNRSKKLIDILAPGEKISAARLGGGYVTHSGTSMASPYMAREVARLWMKHPTLTAAEVREMFIQTAYRMNPAPDVLSGGFVNFEEADRLATSLGK